jgi:hypothetical protein
MKKRLLIATVAATMYVSAMADISISGAATVTFTATGGDDGGSFDESITTVMNEYISLRKMYHSNNEMLEDVTTLESFVGQFDLNKDNKVTKKEVEEYANNRFSELNKDGVGSITKKDLNSSLKNELTIDFTKRFSELDKNKDGLITSAEDFNFTNALTNNEGDINKDGRASLSEYTAFNIKTNIQNTFKGVDSNNDQMISKEEFSVKVIEVMNEFDTDNNKIVDSSD